MDDIANQLGNETMKLTTRQTFQFHGVIKRNLKPAMQAINRALMTTIAACGDVNRNVMCSSLPTQSKYHKEVWASSKKISDHLLPSTTAYHEIWLTDDGKKTQVAGDAVQDFEPLYGPTYLPRKFKITIAIPPHNDTDVYAHDIGLIAIKGEDGHLSGFNLDGRRRHGRDAQQQEDLSADGPHARLCQGRGCAHRLREGHARSARQRRPQEPQARSSKVHHRRHGFGCLPVQGRGALGQKFQPARAFRFESNVDTFGWTKDETGMNHFTFFIENGRIEDTAEFQMKTGLREIAKVHKGEFRLTGNQHLILSNVADKDLVSMKTLMAKYKLDNVQFSGLRLSSSACVAFPTCGLAMAESERYLPVLISKLESCLEENGLRQDAASSCA